MSLPRPLPPPEKICFLELSWHLLGLSRHIKIIAWLREFLLIPWRIWQWIDTGNATLLSFTSKDFTELR